jgi:multicomponent Na+:H+ antiporter subunit D
MAQLVIFPILIPLLTAIATLLLREQRQAQRWLSVIGATALLGSTLGLLANVQREGILVLQLGAWPAPFGIVLVADLLSAIMATLGGLMGFAVAIYSLGSIDAGRERVGYYPLLHVLLMGVNISFLTGDLFNLYVGFEVMLMASFVLMALGGERAQLEGSVKYVTLNLLSSALFLAATGIMYGIAGTLNMADLGRLLGGHNGAPTQAAQPGLIVVVAMLFLVAFGIKAAVFPLFFWLPASYHTPPIAVSAIFAGLLTKVGVYALIRVFTLIFTQDIGYTHTIILVIAGLTMITGVLGAAAQFEIRRILSFHIISQIGYMVMGLALFTPLALAGSVFYLIHHIIVKTNLFLVGGVIQRLRGSYQLQRIGGLYRTTPALAILFLIPAFSLAGIPPLSGFWAKFALVQAGLEVQQYAIVAAALVTGLLTIFSMGKIWAEAFWKEAPVTVDAGGSVAVAGTSAQTWLLLGLPMALLATLTVLIGLLFEPIFVLSNQTAEQLLNPNVYIQAVLGR